MIKDKANIKLKDNSLELSYGGSKITITKGEFERLINENITKDHFLKMASDMVEDYTKYEGYDWSYDKDDLKVKLSSIYESII